MERRSRTSRRLILSGEDDLRTPTANAREVASAIPGSHLLVVPHTGHSVLTDEPTHCASEALQAMFASKPVAPCAPTPPPASLRPPPLPPRRLALVAPARGYGGVPGRTLQAVALTLGDFVRQLLVQVTLSGSVESLFSTLRIGGLRAGWAQLASGALKLHDYTYVPGVAISGSVKAEAETLQVGGSTAAHGSLHRGPHNSLVGTLGGRHVALSAAAIATAAIVGAEDAVASSHSGLRGSVARAAARRLAELLARVEP